MKLLLLIIPLLIGCSTEVVADVDELYSQYACNAGTNASTDPQNPDDTTPPDSINVQFAEVVYMGDASYTEEDAVEECEAAINTAVPVATDVEDGVVSKRIYCQCERSNQNYGGTL